MPLATATPVLATGFLPLFTPGFSTTAQAADAWARAYAQYVVAGGIPAAVAKQPGLAAALTQAFNPAGNGIPAFLQALTVFWLGLPVPAQAGAVAAFLPVNPNLTSSQPPDATAVQQANGLAQVMARLTMGAVKVQPFAPGPPVPIA